MSGEREWLHVHRPRVSHPETGAEEKVQQAPKKRSAQPAREQPTHRLSEVARRAGNQIAQRYAQEETVVAPEHVERSIDAQTGGGSPLDHATRNQMEGAFGADLSSVRVHNDAQADSLNTDLSARAFTRGSDIFFAAGEYAPGTGGGQRLLAHELTHVEQQQDGAKLDVGAANDPAELEADAVADQVVQRIAGGETGGAAVTAQAQRQVGEEEEEDKAQTVRREEDQEEEEPVQP